MVLHGLEGSIRAGSSLSGDDHASDSAFPFAHGNLQPPIIRIIQNVKNCVELFHQRQQEESRTEFYLKMRHNVPGEEDLETVKIVFDRIRQLLDGCNVGITQS